MTMQFDFLSSIHLRYFSCVVFSFYYFCSFSQTQTDSLISAILAKTDSDSIQIIELLKLAHQTNNKNSIQADSIIGLANSIAKLKNQSSLLSAVYNAQAQLYLVRGEYNIAQSYIIQSKKVPNSLPETHNENIRRLNIEGLIHYYQADYTSALPLFFERLELGEQIGDKQIQVRSLNNIGICYERLKEYDKTTTYYLQAIQLLEQGNLEELSEAQLRYMMASLQSNTGAIFNLQQKYDQAIIQLEPAYEAANSLGQQRLRCDAALNLGRAYTGLNQSNKANVYFNEALSVANKLNDPARIITSSIIMAGNFQKTNQLAKVEPLLLSAEKLIHEKGIKEQLVPLHEQLIKLYSGLGEFEKISSIHSSADFH